jgi:hypothetical protein
VCSERASDLARGGRFFMLSALMTLSSTSVAPAKRDKKKKVALKNRLVKHVEKNGGSVRIILQFRERDCMLR